MAFNTDSNTSSMTDETPEQSGQGFNLELEQHVSLPGTFPLQYNPGNPWNLNRTIYGDVPPPLLNPQPPMYPPANPMYPPFSINSDSSNLSSDFPTSSSNPLTNH